MEHQGKDVGEQHYHCYNQQHMDKTSSNAEDEAQKPQYDEKCDNCPKNTMQHAFDLL
jgi:hypothetical protein